MPNDDPHDLQRFVAAQQGVYPKALEELRRGRKESHWMWFIFPQIEGLGRSAMAQEYALSSLAEARAYLDHPLLGNRLCECTRAVLQVQGRPIEQIFGFPDHLKFHSCMTLFAKVSQEGAPFGEALEKYFDAEMDAKTLERL